MEFGASNPTQDLPIFSDLQAAGTRPPPPFAFSSLSPSFSFVSFLFLFLLWVELGWLGRFFLNSWRSDVASQLASVWFGPPPIDLHPAEEEETSKLRNHDTEEQITNVGRLRASFLREFIELKELGRPAAEEEEGAV